MVHPGGAHYRPTGPGPGGVTAASERGSGFKFRRIRSFKDLILVYILEFCVFILPVVDGGKF